MGDEQSVERYAAMADEAWEEFRRQLADFLGELDEGRVLRLELEQATSEDELDGAAPYVQFLRPDGAGTVRAEVCSNQFLASGHRLDEPQHLCLWQLGWGDPDLEPGESGEGSPHHFADVEPREADRLAMMTVGALRDVFGCLHPAFLEVYGDLVLTGPLASAAPEGPDATEEASGTDRESDEEPIAWPASSEELRQMVDQALMPMLGDDVPHDDDGDVMLPFGSSVLYLRSFENEPIVELYAQLLHDVQDLERAAFEVNILNRDLVLGTVVLHGDQVLLHHRLSASPLVPDQLRAVVVRVASDLDQRAQDLQVRVGGRLFAEPASPGRSVTVPAEEGAADEPVDADDHEPAEGVRPEPMGRLSVLRELLAAGERDPATLAALYDGEMLDLTAQLEGLREQPPADLDVADAIAALREALRFVVTRRARELFRPRRPFPKRPESRQASLLSPADLGEQALDLGVEG